MRNEDKQIWSDELVKKAVKILKNHGPFNAAQMLGVKYHSMRMALSRRGIRLKQFRKYQHKRGHRTGAFTAPDGANRPFVAMDAMEADKGGCRFPLGDLDSGDYRFCGAEKAGSYCSHHYSIMRIAGSSKWTLEQYEKWLKG